MKTKVLNAIGQWALFNMLSNKQQTLLDALTHKELFIQQMQKFSKKIRYTSWFGAWANAYGVQKPTIQWVWTTFGVQKSDHKC